MAKISELRNEVRNDVRRKVERFAERSARTGRVNFTVILSTTLMSALLLLALGVQVKDGSSSMGKLQYIPIFIIAAGLFVDWGIFLKNRDSENLRYFMMASFFTGYLFLLLAGKNEFIPFYIFPSFISDILFFDKRLINLSAIGIITANLARLLIAGVMDNAVFTGCALSIILTLVISEATKLTILFDSHTAAAMEREQTAQKEMLDDMLTTAASLQQDIKDSVEIIDMLKSSSEIVNSSLSEITSSSQMSAESVQDQTIMTHSIQEAINDTVELSREMVDMAQKSGTAMRNSIQMMEEVEAQSTYIGKANEQVAASMERLQIKMQEVQNIAGMIFNISSQTNLLALNASIESARAGEAGRGFAVVANQIRSLAEETRKATENIKTIIEELSENAREAVENVQDSMNAVKHQNELIGSATVEFEGVGDNIGVLTTNISTVDSKIGGLADANDTIVDSISQLSAVSEEITANTTMAEERSGENVQNAEQAYQIFMHINSLAEVFNKYI